MTKARGRAYLMNDCETRPPATLVASSHESIILSSFVVVLQ